MRHLTLLRIDVFSVIKRSTALFTVRGSALYRRNYDLHGRLRLLVLLSSAHKDVTRESHDSLTTGHCCF